MRDSERVRLWKRTGRSYRDAAQEVGADPTSVWAAVRGRIKRPRPEIAAVISRTLGREPADVFPALRDAA